ncbi:hypothetical protein [Erysipelothrix anatis]|uniref:hypothetical protein n=1 Tax=Erysipelothrix anatis TaxID=2683713 RepID=UPI00135BC2BE|nr:hypothetical protein [Erysipelothrix anatis]
MELSKYILQTNGLLQSEQNGSGVIKYTEDIMTTYFLAELDVKAVQVFASAKVSNDAALQLSHTTKLIEVIQNTFMVLIDVDQAQANEIMKLIGMFDGSFVDGKQAAVYDYLIKVEVANGLILVAVTEVS